MFQRLYVHMFEWYIIGLLLNIYEVYFVYLCLFVNCWNSVDILTWDKFYFNKEGKQCEAVLSICYFKIIAKCVWPTLDLIFIEIEFGANSAFRVKKSDRVIKRDTHRLTVFSCPIFHPGYNPLRSSMEKSQRVQHPSPLWCHCETLFPKTRIESPTDIENFPLYKIYSKPRSHRRWIQHISNYL